MWETSLIVPRLFTEQKINLWSLWDTLCAMTNCRICVCYDFENSATHHNNRKKLLSRASPEPKIMKNLVAHWLNAKHKNGCSIWSIDRFIHQANLIAWLSLDKTVPKTGPIKSAFLFLLHTNQSHMSRIYIEISVCLYRNEVFFSLFDRKKKKKKRARIIEIVFLLLLLRVNN